MADRVAHDDASVAMTSQDPDQGTLCSDTLSICVALSVNSRWCLRHCSLGSIDGTAEATARLQRTKE